MEKVNENDKEYRFGDWGPKYMTRGPNLEWGVLLLKPGTTIGKHMHEQVEEIFYFLEGEGEMLVADKKFRVTPGDAIRIEPQEAHDIINDTQELLKAIFIKSPYLPEDKISL